MLARRRLVVFRLLFGLLGLVAVGAQLGVHIQHDFNVANFLSYFTNLSNIFAAVVLLAGAYHVLHTSKTAISWELVRGAATLCMAIVGIVYFVLLRHEDLGSLLPWVNAVVHYVMPVIVVADWLLAPPKMRLRVKHLLLWLVFPAIYVTYSLVRGAIVGWYPYPFINPAKVDGYLGVTVYCLGILAVFFVAGWLLILASRQTRKMAKR